MRFVVIPGLAASAFDDPPLPSPTVTTDTGAVDPGDAAAHSRDALDPDRWPT